MESHQRMARPTAYPTDPSPLAQVGSRQAIVPGEAPVVEEGPGESQAKGQDRQGQGHQTPAALRAAGVEAVEGAELDAGVSHAGRGSGESEEKCLIGGADGQQGERGAQFRSARAGELAGMGRSQKGSREKRRGDEGAVDHDASRRRLMGASSTAAAGAWGAGSSKISPWGISSCVLPARWPVTPGASTPAASRRGWRVHRQRVPQPRVEIAAGSTSKMLELRTGFHHRQGPFGEPWTHFARGDQLARELDEIGIDGLDRLDSVNIASAWISREGF